MMGMLHCPLLGRKVGLSYLYFKDLLGWGRLASFREWGDRGMGCLASLAAIAGIRMTGWGIVGYFYQLVINASGSRS